jgi:predicted nucleotidyltransferase
MIQAQDFQIASLFKQRLQAITPVKRLIVFGSRARGDAVRDSDLDVFVELPELNKNLRQQVIEIAWEIGFENGVVISVFLTSTPLLKDSPLAGNPILRAIQLEGVPV